ncbi:MAG: ArsA family ATPase [Candidatus Thorarchaeota archaeon]
MLITSNFKDLVQERQFVFFGGKGGVGKTTMAASTAVWLADQGYDTLVIATDPTVSLPTIFEQEMGDTTLTSIKGFDNLSGLTINPKMATGAFQGRLQSFTDGFTSIFGNGMMNTPCVEEMAAFDQFVAFMQNNDHDKIVFDTAPTGHTLRELSMPFDWSDFMAQQIRSKSEISSLFPFASDSDMVEELETEKRRYDDAIKNLSSVDKTSFNLVLKPERLPIAETARAINDLAGFGITVQGLIINEVIPRDVLMGNWFLERRSSTQEKYLREINTDFGRYPRKTVPLFETDIHGLDSLRRVGGLLYDE